MLCTPIPLVLVLFTVNGAVEEVMLTALLMV